MHEEVRKTMASYAGQSEAEILARGRSEHPTWSEAELAPWAKSKTQFDPTLFERLQMNMTTYEELVPKISVPTLLITADGGIVSGEVTERARALATAPFTTVRINEAGHNIRREQPAVFMHALREFLNNLQ